VYSPVDTEIVPPEFVRSRLPKDPPPGVRSEDLSEVEVIISATGEVESVKLVTQPVRVLSAMMLSAVKNWRFQPATKDGHPVRYRLRLRLTNQ
jgi:TonB family protein